MIENGKKVTFDYVLKVNGETVDSSSQRGPIEYMHGEEKIIKGLEKQMTGLQIGEKRSITVSPEEGYGPVDSEAFKEVPRSMLGKDITPEVGQQLALQHPNGQNFPVVISDVRDETIVLNLNHPLAGQELHFDVTVVNVQ